MILCADCEADLSQVTGSLTHETSACPFCGSQVFERYEEDETFGPGTWDEEAET